MASKTKHTGNLKRWAKATVSHFWACAMSCHGDADRLKSRWHSILWHIQGVHEWTVGGCHHAVGKDSELLVLAEDSPSFAFQ